MTSVSNWDPLSSHDWDKAGPPGNFTSARIRRDILLLKKDPVPDLFVCPDENDLTLVSCIVVGAACTPYKGGFFNFLFRFGPSYPMHPPRVRFTTTDGGRISFNPHIYSNGKVCLSTLGTMTCSSWTPTSSLKSVLLSLQSIMHDNLNHDSGLIEIVLTKIYKSNKAFITHETLRVAVCNVLESILFRKDEASLPEDFHPYIKTRFLEFYDYYLSACDKNKAWDGKKVRSTYSSCFVKAEFNNLALRLKKIKEALQKENEDDGSSLIASPEVEGLEGSSSAENHDVAIEMTPQVNNPHALRNAGNHADNATIPENEAQATASCWRAVILENGFLYFLISFVFVAGIIGLLVHLKLV